MAMGMQRLVKPRNLAHCALEDSTAGRFRERLWRSVINSGRSSEGLVLDKNLAEKTKVLRKEGIVRGAARDFLTKTGASALAAVDAEVRAMVATPENQAVLAEGSNDALGKTFLIRLIDFSTPHDGESNVLRLALDENILRIVAKYMGINPVLHGMAAWYNFPVSQAASFSQLWHRDPEDVKTVKVFIYLDEVGPDNGPFTYLPRTHPLGADSTKTPIHEHPRRITGPEMERVFDRQRWLECCGPAQSLIMADTVGFHRGGYVKCGHRTLVTFTYTSARPQKPRSLQVHGKIPEDFGDLQRAALDL
jgi:hypothetical protein